MKAHFWTTLRKHPYEGDLVLTTPVIRLILTQSDTCIEKAGFPSETRSGFPIRAAVEREFFRSQLFRSDFLTEKAVEALSIPPNTLSRLTQQPEHLSDAGLTEPQVATAARRGCETGPKKRTRNKAGKTGGGKTKNERRNRSNLVPAVESRKSNETRVRTRSVNSRKVIANLFP